MTNINKMTRIACLVLAASSVSILAGCHTNPPADQGKIEVIVTKVERVAVKVPESILDKCKKPKQLSKTFPELQSGKVKEKEAIAAIVDSYTNEVNCWLVKNKAIELQDKLEADLVNPVK